MPAAAAAKASGKKRSAAASPAGSGSKKRARTAEVAALYDGEVFDVPGCPRAAEPAGPAWPADELDFSYWTSDTQFTLQAKILERRGWKSIGDPCDPKNIYQLEKMANGTRRRPKRALYLDPGFSEINFMKLWPETRGLTPPGAAYRISAFPGMEAACYKRSTAAHMKRQGVDFYPDTYTMPQDRAQFLRVLSEGKSLWIAKPHNGYSGKGVVAFSSRSKELRDLVKDDSKKAVGTVVQRYIANPLLAGGYKMHMRIYVLVTSLGDEPAGYVLDDGHVMFATKLFTTAESSLGKSFDQKAHLTNFDINVRLDNADRVLANKPVVGPTAGWGMRRLESLYTKQTGRTRADLWQQIVRICEAVVKGIASHVPTKVACSKNVAGRHFQLFGLDLMPDAKGKVWLLEANDSPGLASCDPYLEARGADGKCGTEDAKDGPSKVGLAIRKAMATDERITLSVCDAIYSVLGMDAGSGAPGNAIGRRRWFQMYAAPAAGAPAPQMP